MGGGLSSENPIAITQDQMVIADNLLIGTTLSRRKRGGQAKFHLSTLDLTASFPPSGSLGTPVRGIIEFWRSASLAGNPVSDVFLHQDSKLWSIDNRLSVGLERQGSLTIETTGVPCYQPFNSKLYFTSTNVADGYNKWDGASASAVPATPPPDGPGKYIIAHLGRMAMAGNADFPFRIYLSSAYAPETWDDAGEHDGTSLDLPDDGDPEGITGLASFQGRLYVWTRRTLHEITGTTNATFVRTQVSNGVGCIGHASICALPNDVLFCSDRGVHFLKQVQSGRQTETDFRSRDIQRLWTDLLNAALYFRIAAVYDETCNNVLISIPSSGQTKNDQVLAHNIEFGTWTVWPNINARSMCPVLIGNKKSILIGKEDGTIALINQAARDDLGDAYPYRFKTGIIYPGGDPSIESRITSITVLASTNADATLRIAWTIDGVKNGFKTADLTATQDLLGTTFVLGTSKLGIGQFLPRKVTVEDVGHGIQIEVSTSAKADVEVYGFIIEAEALNGKFT